MQAAGGAALNDSAAPAGPDPAQRPRRIRLLVIIAVTVFVADLVSKTLVVATLSHQPPLRLLGGLLTLRVLRNSGAAFSIGTSMTFVFSLIAVGVIVAILRTARRLRSIPWAVTLGLLLGGAAGNLGDRIFRSPGPFRGYVVDWIQLPHWPVFNIADSCIVCGGVLAVLLAARGIPLDGGQPDGVRPHGEQPDGEQPDSARPDGERPAGTRPDGDCPDEPRSAVLDGRPAAGRPVTGDGGP
ncbi:MAG TPA: signal peptidase II [Streptosporangiaceae bacterium]|nr:signal peptidase II [Streptosporangiaceae bacterium]